MTVGRVTRGTADAFNKRVGAKLRAWRGETDAVTLDFIAASLGISEAQIYRYEAGDTALTVVRAQQWCQLFGRDVGDFWK